MATQPRIKLFSASNSLYHSFSLASSHSVNYKGVKYLTAQHLVESLKFLEYCPHIVEHIQTSRKPAEEAQRYQDDVRPDWDVVKTQMMAVTLYHKFTQHDDLRTLLLNTGYATLIANSWDPFWGRTRGQGLNKLGELFEALRTNLRFGEAPPLPRRMQFDGNSHTHSCFTISSPHPITYRGVTYPTSGHLLQSFKFPDNWHIVQEILERAEPQHAFDTAQKYPEHVRQDWQAQKITALRFVIYQKFKNRGLRQILLDTAYTELVEASPKDPFSGGEEKEGNQLGKALMRERNRLRSREPAPGPPGTYYPDNNGCCVVM